MSNPMSNADLPELPLNKSLSEHIQSYVLHLGNVAETLKDGEGKGYETLARAVSQIHEDLWGILEFHHRETEFHRGSECLKLTTNLAKDAAYVSVLRDGEVVHKVGMDRTKFAEFTDGANQLLSSMVDRGE